MKTSSQFPVLSSQKKAAVQTAALNKESKLAGLAFLIGALEGAAGAGHASLAA